MTIFSLSANAQSLALKKSLTGVDANSFKSSFTVPLSFESSSSMHQEWSADRVATSTFTTSPFYRMTPQLRFSGSLSLTKEHSDQGNSNFENSAAGVSYLLRYSDRLTQSFATTGYLPTNPIEREEKSYQGGLRLSTGLGISEIWMGSFLNLRLNLTRHFHGYSQGADGSYNIKQAIGPVVDYTQPMGKVFSLVSVLGYTQAWTYLDDTRYSFLIILDLYMQATDKFSVSVGTANSGSALKPNGRDSNIEFFNDETSIVKIGLSYVL